MTRPRPAKARWAALPVLALLLAASCVHARDNPDPLFESASELTVTLQADWRQILRNKEDETRHPAVLGYVDDAGHEHRIEATVETRGITRLRICRFPPLRTRFKRDATRGTEFDGERSLKMVTHCRTGAAYAQYYVQELIAFRIYNRVTDHSFRVRPLLITYLDMDGDTRAGPAFAFLIEDDDDVARRNGHREGQRMPLAPGDYDPLALTRFMLFQYLIGNTDWKCWASPEWRSAATTSA